MADETNNSLFSQDVLDSMEAPHLFNQKHEGPVTVLGKMFDSDEERRAYFREELRKKLPELKKIEGFPIGEDDDIIALSDPPYYTACPNPWLNDFVAEWEEEKIQNDNVENEREIIPYATDVSEGKNNPIYNAHSYHTKVPHPAIMRYILHYTNPGDIVFDGFAGTGMTGVAAWSCGNPTSEDKAKIEKEWKDAKKTPPVWGKRNAICGDLSPFARFIAYNYNIPTNPDVFRHDASKILDEVEKEYGWMYETNGKNGQKGRISYVVWSDVLICPHCGKEFSFFDAAVDMDKQHINDDFPCPHCGTTLNKRTCSNVEEHYYDDIVGETSVRLKTVPAFIKYDRRFIKRPDADDLALIDTIEKMPVPYWVPTDYLPDGDKTFDAQKCHITRAHHFYTRRNLIIASVINHYTEGKGVLNVLLTSYLNTRGSKMTRYKLEKAGNAMLPGTLYIASVTAEQNLFDGYRGKIADFYKVYGVYNCNIVNVASATKTTIADNSIDYIFTDPPFGANLMYSELNFLQESWLKVRTNNQEEAIQNKSQNKSLFDYQELMQRSFAEYYRILKPGKWITIEFSNTSASVWNSIQQGLQAVGFIISNVAALDKKQGSFNAYTSTTAVKQDLVITCFKPTAGFVERFTYNAVNAESVWDFVEEYLLHLPVHLERGNATTTVIERSPKILFDRLISYYVQKGLPVPIDASDFQMGLRERYIEEDGMFFTPSQIAEYREKKKLAPEFISMGLIVSSESDGIEWLRNRLRDKPQTYQQISPDWMQAINGIRKGDVLPELMEILDENFIQEPDGKWRLPNIQDDIDKDKLREKALLKEFKIYVEAASKPRARIKEVRVEAIRAGFKRCYMDKDFATIVLVGDKIPQNLLTEDEILLQFYDIARTRV